MSYVCDLSEERCSYVKSLYPNTQVTNDFNKILNSKDIDAVIISTPANTHFQLAKQALQNGKHILVEKPLAMHVAEVDELESIALEKKLVCMVGHTFLYNSAVRYIKTLIDKGELGKIRYIYSQRLNLGIVRKDIDVVWNLAPHDVSIMQYFLNEQKPSSIKIVGMDYIQKGINDVAFMTLTYPNNVCANIHVSWLDPHKVRKITIVGSKKMVVYDDVASDKVIIYEKGIEANAINEKEMDFDDPNSYDLSLISGDAYIPKINWEEPLSAEVQHFFDCISQEINCLTGTKHARNVVEILSGG